MIELMKRIDEPNPKWLLNRFETFPLPTEMVVWQPGYVIPDMGRCYRLRYHECDGKFYDTMTELRESDEFQLNGWNNFKDANIYLYEVWRNYGDDGHTEYSLSCWILIQGRYEGNPANIANDLYDILYRKD